MIFTLAAFLLGISSCARTEQSSPRYNPKQCPFCSLEKGKCSYCHGTKKCNLCLGTGKRLTAAPDLQSEGIKKSSYSETCPYCKGNGVCRYCDGAGSCWACKGTGEAGDWDFYSRFKKLKEIEVASLEAVAAKPVQAEQAPAPKGK